MNAFRGSKQLEREAYHLEALARDPRFQRAMILPDTDETSNAAIDAAVVSKTGRDVWAGDVAIFLGTVSGRVQVLERGASGWSGLDITADLAGEVDDLKFRLDGFVTLTEHFDGGSLPSGWAWAGAPFGTPATVSFSIASHLRVVFSAAAGERNFLYQNAAPATNLMTMLSLSGLTIGMHGGLRLDDGSDNNYVEVVLEVTQSTPTLWAEKMYWRVGGGAVNSVVGDNLNFPGNFILQMSVAGTPWSGWHARPLLRYSGSAGVMWKPNTGMAGSSLTWTPTRAGLVGNDGGGASTSDNIRYDAVVLT